MGFRVRPSSLQELRLLGFSVWGLGFRVQGFRFRVLGLGFRVWGVYKTNYTEN